MFNLKKMDAILRKNLNNKKIDYVESYYSVKLTIYLSIYIYIYLIFNRFNMNLKSSIVVTIVCFALGDIENRRNVR